jgi:hypothetical protein
VSARDAVAARRADSAAIRTHVEAGRCPSVQVLRSGSCARRCRGAPRRLRRHTHACRSRLVSLGRSVALRLLCFTWVVPGRCHAPHPHAQAGSTASRHWVSAPPHVAILLAVPAHALPMPRLGLCHGAHEPLPNGALVYLKRDPLLLARVCAAATAIAATPLSSSLSLHPELVAPLNLFPRTPRSSPPQHLIRSSRTSSEFPWPRPHRHCFAAAAHRRHLRRAVATNRSMVSPIAAQTHLLACPGPTSPAASSAPPPGD